MLYYFKLFKKKTAIVIQLSFVWTTQAAHGQGYPIELNSMIGEFFMLNIDVTQKNIEDNWQTYTVKKLSHDQAIISKYRLKHNIEVTKNPLHNIYHANI